MARNGVNHLDVRKLVERNTRDRHKDVISSSSLHVNRSDLRLRLVSDDRIIDRISRGAIVSPGRLPCAETPAPDAWNCMRYV